MGDWNRKKKSIISQIKGSAEIFSNRMNQGEDRMSRKTGGRTGTIQQGQRK